MLRSRSCLCSKSRLSGQSWAQNDLALGQPSLAARTSSALGSPELLFPDGHALQRSVAASAKHHTLCDSWSYSG